MTPTNRQGSAPPSDATRGRLLALLREGVWTVDDLAERLELTDNAVRFHLAALEREGGVAKAGVQRRQGSVDELAALGLDPAARRPKDPVMQAPAKRPRQDCAYQAVSFLGCSDQRYSTMRLISSSVSICFQAGMYSGGAGFLASASGGIFPFRIMLPTSGLV